MKKLLLTSALCFLIGSAFSVTSFENKAPVPKKQTAAVDVVSMESNNVFTLQNHSSDVFLVQTEITLPVCEAPVPYTFNVVIIHTRNINTFFDHRLIYRYKHIVSHIRPPTGIA